MTYVNLYPNLMSEVRHLLAFTVPQTVQEISDKLMRSSRSRLKAGPLACKNELEKMVAKPFWKVIKPTADTYLLQ